jgi:hypothetical protein
METAILQATLPIPYLPLELEREIFEMTAISHPRSIPKMMFVAWRVHPMVRPVALYSDYLTTLDILRVEPFLYRIILLSRRRTVQHWPCITVDILHGLISQRPPSFFETSVHHLLIDDMTEDSFDPAPLRTIGSACCGVTDLFLNLSISPLMPFVHGMNSLRRLGISLETLFGGVTFDFTQSAFTNITHLEIFDQKNIDISLSLAPLRNLTHLSGIQLLPFSRFH